MTTVGLVFTEPEKPKSETKSGKPEKKDGE